MSACRTSLLAGLFLAALAPAAAPPLLRRDIHGDILPGGAVARLGAVHPRAPGRMAFTAGGKEVVTFVPNRGMYRWDVATGRLLARVPDENLGSVIPDLWFLNRDGTLAAEVLVDTIRIIDPRSGKIRHRLHGDPTRVLAVAFSPDNSLLASSGTTGAVRLYDVASGTIRRRIFTIFDTPTIDWLVFTPDGKTLVSGTGWSYLDLWDVDRGEHRGSLQAAKRVPPGQPDALRFRPMISPDGSTLYVACGDQVQAWDLYEKKHLGAVGSPVDMPASGDARVSLSFDGRLLARLGRDGKLEMFETASGKRLHTFAETGRACAFAPGGWSLANGRMGDHSVPVWEMRELFLSLPAPRPGPESLQTLWEALADDDPNLAHRALWRLAGMKGVEKFLAGKLHVPTRVDAARLKKLLEDLTSDQLAARQRSERELARLVETSRELIQRARRQARDFELILRLDRLLAQGQPPAHPLRELRAVMVLEACGTPEARKLLERLAGGALESRLTREARATLVRMPDKR